MKDQIIKFLAYNGKIPVVCCSTTNLVEEARKLHDLAHYQQPQWEEC